LRSFAAVPVPPPGRLEEAADLDEAARFATGADDRIMSVAVTVTFSISVISSDAHADIQGLYTADMYMHKFITEARWQPIGGGRCLLRAWLLPS